MSDENRQPRSSLFYNVVKCFGLFLIPYLGLLGLLFLDLAILKTDFYIKYIVLNDYFDGQVVTRMLSVIYWPLELLLRLLGVVKE